MSRPSVLHFANPDTVRLILLPELLALQEAGVKVSVLTGESPRAQEARDHGLDVTTIPFTRRMAPLQDLRTLMAVVRHLRRERPAVLHTHNPKPNLVGTIAATLARVPVVIHTVHGRYTREDTSWLERQIMRLSERLELRGANRILVVNREDADAFERIAPGAKKIIFLGGGITLEKFNPEGFPPQGVQRIRQGLGIPEDHQVVGTVGRLVEEKGYLDLFEAFRTLRRRVSNVTLLVVGMQDPEKPDALPPNIAERYGVQDNVVFVEEAATPDLYAAMDVFVLASYREGLPRTPMEAAAMGKPLVLTYIRGCREIVDQGTNGHLVPVKDPRTLADTLLSLLEDHALRESLARGAREKALKEFDNQKTVQTMLHVYLSQLQPSPEMVTP